jgi:hypothetical protein
MPAEAQVAIVVAQAQQVVPDPVALESPEFADDARGVHGSRLLRKALLSTWLSGAGRHPFILQRSTARPAWLFNGHSRNAALQQISLGNDLPDSI